MTVQAVKRANFVCSHVRAEIPEETALAIVSEIQRNFAGGMLVRPRAIGRSRLSLRARGEWARKGEQAVPNRQPFGVSYFCAPGGPDDLEQAEERSIAAAR